MDDRGGLLVGYTAAVDFCQPTLPEYEETRRVLEDTNSHGLRIDIRQECWTRLTNSLGNSIKVFLTLRNKASEHLKTSEDDAEALEVFTDEVLQASTLKDIGVDMDTPSVPDIDELEDAVREMGIREFRRYADDQVNQLPREQERLEILIDNRVTKSGNSQTFFEASIRQHISDEYQVQLLLGAYSWARTNPGYLLTRCNSDIHEKKSEIEGCVSGNRLSVVCPEDYRA